MEILIQLLDELDDIFAPMVAMATGVDYWRFASVATATFAAVSVSSPLILCAGLLLAAAGDILPATGRISA